MKRLLLTLLCAGFSLATQAQEAPCTVFDGGTAHTPSGARQGWTVVVAEGRIRALGATIADLQLDAEQATWQGRSCQRVQLQPEQALTPGLVTVSGQLGLIEIHGEPSTHRHDAGGHPVRAAHDVADSYDPLATAIPIARREGITSALITPTGGMVPGQAAWVDLAGSSQADSVARRGAAMVATIDAEHGSTAEGIRRLRELLADARAFASDRRGYEQNRSRDYAAGRLELEALQPLLRGEQPLMVYADRAADIEALLRFAQAERLRLVLVGGAEAWLHAQALAAAGVAVIVNPAGLDPSSFDKLRTREDATALLAQAGVPVIISNRSSIFARHLRQVAGMALREGMDHAAALRAITTVPAQVFGMDDRAGIALGSRADLVVWNGDPLELTTWPLRVMIEGRFADMRSRQTELLERYRELPGLPLPGLDLPEE